MKRSKPNTNLNTLDKTELVDTLLTNVTGGSLSIPGVNEKCCKCVKCSANTPLPTLPRLPGFGL